MSDDAVTSCDPFWYRKAAALSIERRELAAEDAVACAGDSFLIVTEGEVTEPRYFERLRSSLGLSAVHVVVLPGRASEARHVIEHAADLAQKQIGRASRGRLGVSEPTSFDQVWAVIDSDVSERHRRWPDIVNLAKQRNVKLAYSTPCFEYWLLLHIRDTAAPLPNGTAAKAAILDASGHRSDRENGIDALLDHVMPSWPIAVRRARLIRENHRKANTPPPPNPSTCVDELVKCLNFSAPRHQWKLKPIDCV